jgi:hypothetical protein
MSAFREETERFTGFSRSTPPAEGELRSKKAITVLEHLAKANISHFLQLDIPGLRKQKPVQRQPGKS